MSTLSKLYDDVVMASSDSSSHQAHSLDPFRKTLPKRALML
jgi:hypothetical protein